MEKAEEKLIVFFGRKIEEIRALPKEIQKAMKVLASHEDYMGLHHLAYVFWEKKED
jgi:hypothetical protein